MNLKEFTEKYGNKEVEEEELKDFLGIEDNKVWKPRLNDYYWYLNSLGEIDRGFWRNTRTQSYRYSVGNCYKTNEEAIFARDKQIFMTKLERDFEENSGEIDWESERAKYNIAMCDNVIMTVLHVHICLGVPVTTNKEWLANYIKENEEDIRKYYFEKEGKQNEIQTNG